MTALWTHTDAAVATGGRSTAPWQASGVSIDSRTLEPGDLFVAIRGPNDDGHRHVAAALTKGAAAAVVEEGFAEAPAAAPLLRVRDTTAALEDLAHAARRRSAARAVGVTGSVGKTGTKDALARVLSAQGVTIATRGNLNNQWGLPLSLARMPADADFGVFEIGMNHPGEIAPLSRILRPEVAVITTVESVHMEFFASEEAIADAKAEIFAGMGASGAAVLNRDNRHYARLRRHAETAGLGRIVSFGAHEAADVRLVDCALQATCSAVTASLGGETIEYSLGAPGRHWIMNSLAVLAAARLLGADPAMAARGFAELRPARGRGERRRVRLPEGDFELIDESYNASPASMRAAIQVLGRSEPQPGGRRIAVIGDMLELGADAPALHAALAPELVANRVDLVFTAGPNAARLSQALPKGMAGGHGRTSAEILDAVCAAVRPGDVVMVKGSLGSRMAVIVEALAARDEDAGTLAVPARAVNGG